MVRGGWREGGEYLSGRGFLEAARSEDKGKVDRGQLSCKQ